ncbi:MAG: hypothetical protein AB1696_28635 [Planctomycetota bacterium]
MYGLIYFDTEDFFSPPDHPVHRLPGQLADIMHKHGLQGCFHIHGEKARFMERHGQTDVVESIRKHDVSLHYDRGSVHPTTAEEVSELDWFRAVDRVIFRELPGFQALERIFGKCSSLTQHGGTFAAPIAYAAGKMGKPFFYSPFRLPGRNIVWYCNNLLIGGYQAKFYFDTFYRDTHRFEESLAKVNPYLEERAREFDYTAMFGCHPVITMMQKFPDSINFREGASPRPDEWIAPTMIEGVSIPLILENFKRLVRVLVSHPKVEWTTVAGLHDLYGARPVTVRDEDVLEGAEAVAENGGPAYTKLLTAGELLFLLARRAQAPAGAYEVPQIMGPTEEGSGEYAATGDLRIESIAEEIVRCGWAGGYLPPALGEANGRIAPELALVLLACHALGRDAPGADVLNPSLEAIPGMTDAMANLKKYREWGIHGPRYHAEAIQRHFRLQCWTLKPAFTEREYGSGVVLGRYSNPMFDRR